MVLLLDSLYTGFSTSIAFQLQCHMVNKFLYLLIRVLDWSYIVNYQKSIFQRIKTKFWRSWCASMSTYQLADERKLGFCVVDSFVQSLCYTWFLLSFLWQTKAYTTWKVFRWKMEEDILFIQWKRIGDAMASSIHLKLTAQQSRC